MLSPRPPQDTRERAQSFLTDGHIERIARAYELFKAEPGTARVATSEEIRAKDGNSSIPLYVAPVTGEATTNGNLPQSNLPDALGELGWKVRKLYTLEALLK